MEVRSPLIKRGICNNRINSKKSRYIGNEGCHVSGFLYVPFDIIWDFLFIRNKTIDSIDSFGQKLWILR